MAGNLPTFWLAVVLLEPRNGGSISPPETRGSGSLAQVPGHRRGYADKGKGEESAVADCERIRPESSSWYRPKSSCTTTVTPPLADGCSRGNPER